MPALPDPCFEVRADPEQDPPRRLHLHTIAPANTRHFPVPTRDGASLTMRLSCGQEEVLGGNCRCACNRSMTRMFGAGFLGDGG
jgi:hypothetical protein